MKRKFKGLLVGMVVLVGALAFAGCQQGGTASGEVAKETKTGSTTYPVEFTDDLGMAVSIAKEPQKVVSLSPATTEMVFALGQGEKLVGRTDYCNYPEAALAVPSIGDFNSPNVEKIISLAPDVVLSADFISPEIRDQIEATGAKVVLYAPVSITGIMNNIVNTGEVINANDAAKKVVDKMGEDRQAIMDKTKEIKEQKTVFIDVGEFFSAGPGSMLDSMLNDVNGINVAADTGKQWPQLTTEQIIASNPDVYISFYGTPEEIKAVPGFDKITAIKDNAIPYYAFLSADADLIQRPGPRIVEGLRLLAADIYPSLFAE
ncbi:MAG: ABC transporter substrate-binding protein [Eubacteriaceae bacterium]